MWVFVVGAKNTEWASVSFGILFCAACSGEHRGLGTHISRVRSIKMDSWSNDHLKRMRESGNQKCKEFLEKHGIVYQKTNIRGRYDTPAGDLYRDVLDARIEGRPEPTELPKREPAVKPLAPKKKMEGLGSSPPPQANNGRGAVKTGAYVIIAGALVWYLMKN